MSTATRKKDKEQQIKEYNTFVTQIEITGIRLISAKVDLLDYSYFPSSTQVKWRARASYEQGEEEFNVSQLYSLRILDEETNEAKARISVTFYVTYSSKIPMSDDLFEEFKTRNLPLNTWPYFREFVHSITMRMGWLDFIAPTYVTTT